jgi:hypothetical protein
LTVALGQVLVDVASSGCATMFDQRADRDECESKDGGAVGQEADEAEVVLLAHGEHPDRSEDEARREGQCDALHRSGDFDLSALNAILDSPLEVIVGLPLIAQTSWCRDYPNRRWTLRT